MTPDFLHLGRKTPDEIVQVGEKAKATRAQAATMACDTRMLLQHHTPIPN